MSFAITGKFEHVIYRSVSIRGIRAFVSNNVPTLVDIKKGYKGRGVLTIDFEGGTQFETILPSYEELKETVRNWRSLYGTPLTVDGVDKGEQVYYKTRSLRARKIQTV